jgi:hypothetical protein
MYKNNPIKEKFMPTVNLIKNEAKHILKNRWSTALAISFIILAMLFLGVAGFGLIHSLFINILGKVSAIAIALVFVTLLWQFLGVPLLYGTLRWTWYSSLNNDIPFYEIFYYFGSGYNYIRAISLGFRIFLRIVIILALCFTPSIIILVACMPQLYNFLNFPMPYFVSSLWALGNVLELFGGTLSVILLLRYVSAPILLINNEKLSPQEALNFSVIISKFANGRTLSFLLSFSGWLIISILILPLLYAIPFFFVSYSIYCKYLMENYNRIVDFENSKMYPNYEPNTFM